MKRIFEEYGGLITLLHCMYVCMSSCRQKFLHFAVIRARWTQILKKNGAPLFRNSLGSIGAPKTLAVWPKTLAICAFHFIDGWQHRNDSDLDDSDNVRRYHSLLLPPPPVPRTVIRARWTQILKSERQSIDGTLIDDTMTLFDQQ